MSNQRFYTVRGTYGSGNNPADIFIYVQSNGLKWYVVEGGVIVNCTDDDIPHGCNVEELNDVDCFTWDAPIEDMEDFQDAIYADNY